MKPNVLHLIDSFESGGTERQALQLVRLLRESGRCSVRLACLQNTGPLRVEADRVGLGEIPEYHLNSFYDWNFLRQVRGLVRFLKDNEIDLVHTHDFYTNIFGMTAAMIAGVDARIASRRETNGFRNSMQKRVERIAFRLAHRVVANSDAVRDQLISEGVPAKKIMKVYNGLDVDRVRVVPKVMRSEVLATLGLPTEPARRFVTIIANLNHAVKDHPTFLRAAARVHAKVPNAGFIIAGEGLLMSSLRELAAQTGIGRDVFFLGRCEDLANLLSISEVGVLSSKAEGFANVILEYMAAGLPVVATAVGGAREVIQEGETGYTVAPGDDESMAERIIQLLREPDAARRMGKHGRSIVEQNFSGERQLSTTLELYEELLARQTEAGIPLKRKIQESV